MGESLLWLRSNQDAYSVGKWQRSTDWDDFPPEKIAFFRRTPDWCRHQARMLGDEVRKAVETLLEDHALYHLRQIHGFSG